MTKTDRQTDKTTRWAFTAYEDQYKLVDDMGKSSVVAEYGWNPEICPETGRKHRQGYLRTKIQVRFSALRKEFPGIHFEVAKNWEALMNYCRKEETREKGMKSFSGTGSKERPLTMAAALIKLCSYADPKPIIRTIPIEIEDTLRGKPMATYREEWVPGEYDSRAMYVSAVKNWLKINPDIVALVTQPQYKSAFMDFWQDFQAIAVELALHGPEESEGYSITPELDEEVVEPPEDDWNEYAFRD